MEGVFLGRKEDRGGVEGCGRRGMRTLVVVI